MTVYIGNAVGDENNKARGGEAGDQTGKELRIQPWYKHEKGWRVFRCKDKAKSIKIASDMRMACNNPHIGYDQHDRNTLYTVSSPLHFDCGLVTEECECDCSSLVRVCCAYAGIKLKDFNSVSGPSRLLNSGEFIELEGSEYTKSPKKLMEGDILCTSVKGHMCVALNDGPDVDPDPPKPEPPEPPTPPEPTKYKVYVIGNRVNVREKDSKAGEVMFTARKGNRFPMIDVAPSGWYHIETYKGEGYISNREDLTCLITV